MSPPGCRALHPDAGVFQVPAPGTTVVQGNSSLALPVPQHAPGRKHERRIVLEAWQEEIVRAFPAAFLRVSISSPAGVRPARPLTGPKT